MQAAPNNRELSGLWYADTAKAIARCRAALRKHHGHRVRAAAELKISPRTFYRWMREHPEIGAGFDEMYKPTPEEAAKRLTKRLRTMRQTARAARS